MSVIGPWHVASRSIPVSCSIFLLTFSVAARAPQRQARHAIRVQTDLVIILASVTDSAGEPVPDLPQSAFQLSEEGHPQKIARFETQTNRPLDLALMVDTSMSETAELRPEAVAAARFIREVVRPGDSAAIFQFADSVDQLSAFTDDTGTLQKAAMRMTPGTGTSMYDALVLGARQLAARPPNRRRAIILVTDAGETTSSYGFDDARQAMISSGALLYSIILRPVPNENGRNTGGEHALITITDGVGGALFTLFDFKQINALFDRINRELRTQYLLGYYPDPSPPANSIRRVQLAVKGDYAVRYTKLYYTAAAP